MSDPQLPEGWRWTEHSLGWSLMNKGGHAMAVVNKAVCWAEFSWSARRSKHTLWGDSEKGAPAKDLETAQSEVLDYIITSKLKHHARVAAQELEKLLSECSPGIEVGHAGDHLGIPHAMDEPYPTVDEVRARFNAMTEAEQCAATDELFGCPW